jgi:hypothetical protein
MVMMIGGVGCDRGPTACSLWPGRLPGCRGIGVSPLDAKPTESPSTEARREFLHKAAKVGIATPAAVTLMLAAATKRARAVRVRASPK